MGVRVSALGKLRETIYDALSGVLLDGTAVFVHRDVTESLEPPCYLLSWGNPMLEPMTGCNFTARPAVICVGGRLNAVEGQTTVEDLIEAAVPRLRGLMPVEYGDQLQQLEVGGITYLASRLTLRTTVNI
jgi:hypothetical protein